MGIATDISFSSNGFVFPFIKPFDVKSKEKLKWGQFSDIGTLSQWTEENLDRTTTGKLTEPSPSHTSESLSEA